MRRRLTRPTSSALFLTLAIALVTVPLPAYAAPDLDGRLGIGRGGGVNADVGLNEGNEPSESDEGLGADSASETASGGNNAGASNDGRTYVVAPAPGHSGDPDDGNMGWCRGYEPHDVTGFSDQEVDQFLQDAALAVEVTFERISTMQGWTDLGVEFDTPCSDETNLVALSGPVAENAVRDYISEQLPRPSPRIPPGYALTGLPAYLVTEHQLTYGPATTTLDFGVMTAAATVSASGSTTVDWGDGTVETYDVVGTPYPAGQVKHTYTDRGTVSVSVVDTWTVNYDIADGTLTGTLTAELDPVSIGEFEVREYRAVRVSP